jgi:hypothetical protein
VLVHPLHLPGGGEEKDMGTPQIKKTLLSAWRHPERIKTVSNDSEASSVEPLTAAGAHGTRFMESFRRKRRFGQLMKRIPLPVTLPSAALVGCAAYGLENFKEES